MTHDGWMRLIRKPLALAGLLLLSGIPAGAAGPADLAKIEHIVVIYLENRSFDHIFGSFPGANGLANAGAAGIQVDETDQPVRLPARSARPPSQASGPLRADHRATPERPLLPRPLLPIG